MGSGGRGEQGRFAASNRRRSIGVMDEGCAGIPLLSMAFSFGEGKARWHFYRFRACPWALAARAGVFSYEKGGLFSGETAVNGDVYKRQAWERCYTC